MARYRKKPVVVDAIQYDGENFLDVCRAFACDVITEGPGYSESIVFESGHSAALDMRARAGDWIIRDVDGKLYPCKADIFEATYESVAE